MANCYYESNCRKLGSQHAGTVSSCCSPPQLARLTLSALTSRARTGRMRPCMRRMYMDHHDYRFDCVFNERSGNDEVTPAPARNNPLPDPAGALRGPNEDGGAGADCRSVASRPARVTSRAALRRCSATMDTGVRRRRAASGSVGGSRRPRHRHDVWANGNPHPPANVCSVLLRRGTKLRGEMPCWPERGHCTRHVSS